MSRARSSSFRQIQEGLAQMPTHHEPKSAVASQQQVEANGKGSPVVPVASFFSDIITFRWMTVPVSSLKLIGVLAVSWAVLELLPNVTRNPLTPLFVISHTLPALPGDAETRYSKGPLDFAFLAFYVIFFSFLRQSMTEWVIAPFARWIGLRSKSKVFRFMEQGYAFLYFSCTTALGCWIMYKGDTWFFETDHLWLNYPDHWRMTGPMKAYYLLQSSYWIQQMLVLALRLEKPRSDYYQLICHHFVTLHLVGWSYFTNLTVIGNLIFVTMDSADVFLAASKCLNYAGLQRTSEVSFLCLLGVWTYTRHYLNIVILWSVWHKFDLVPEYYRTWTDPSQGWAPSGLASFLSELIKPACRLPPWIRYQIFAPIMALQCVNAFWTFLLYKILVGILLGQPASDIREEGEDEEGEKGEVASVANKKNQ